MKPHATWPLLPSPIAGRPGSETPLVSIIFNIDKLGSPFNGNFLSTPDGMRLVLGTSAGLALMGNDGTPQPTLPGAVAYLQLRRTVHRWSTETPGVLRGASDPV